VHGACGWSIAGRYVFGIGPLKLVEASKGLVADLKIGMFAQ
jgi:hypothetical protein